MEDKARQGVIFVFNIKGKHLIPTSVAEYFFINISKAVLTFAGLSNDFPIFPENFSSTFSCGFDFS